MTFTIRPAMPADSDLILALVKELADYERLSAEVDTSPQMLAEALFGSLPRVFCEIAESHETDGSLDPAGFALWFYNFSTFRGRHGIYLEDLFVRPRHRGKGLGKALMAGLAKRCVSEDLARLEWSVLDWNETAIRFYEAQGAILLTEWSTCRMTGPALWRLAEGIP